MVGFSSTPYSCRRCQKYNLNSLPLSYTTSVGRGYRQNHVLFTSFAIVAEVLSNVSWHFIFPFLSSGVSIRGNSTISNHPVAGSIMVRHMKSTIDLSLPFNVYGPIKSTHNVRQGSSTANFSGTFPYFFEVFYTFGIWGNISHVFGQSF